MQKNYWSAIKYVVKVSIMMDMHFLGLEVVDPDPSPNPEPEPEPQPAPEPQNR